MTPQPEPSPAALQGAHAQQSACADILPSVGAYPQVLADQPCRSFCYGARAALYQVYAVGVPSEIWLALLNSCSFACCADKLSGGGYSHVHVSRSAWIARSVAQQSFPMQALL